jgi:predicted nucleotidyltransferase
MKRNGRRRPTFDTYLRGAVQRIRKAFPETRRIVLFGSRAYGRPTGDSDLDLFIELPTRQSSHRRHQAIDRLLDPRPCGIDLIVKTPQEIRRMRRDFNPCVEEILTRGRVLYDKAR